MVKKIIIEHRIVETELITCQVCKGTGKIVNRNAYPLRYKICDNCGGTGKVRQ